jgi:hypothetical protein
MQLQPADAIRAAAPEGSRDSNPRVAMMANAESPGISPAGASVESALREPVVAAPALDAETDDEPLRLEINDGHFYMEGHCGVLEFRITNCSDERMKELRLTAVGQRLGVANEIKMNLAAHGRRDARIQIEPQRGGEHVIDVTMESTLGRNKQSWTSQARLKILGRNENPSTIVVDQSLHAGNNIGYGMSMRNEVRDGIASGLIKDVNDLIRQQYSESWKPLQLTPTDAVRSGVVQLVSEFANQPALQKATLSFESAGACCHVHVLGLPEVRLGRSREQNDLVLRRLPRSKESDQLSLQISDRGPHLRISLRKEGLFLIDHMTANGTWFNGNRIRDEVQLPLDRSSEVDVAHALRLRLTPHLDSHSVGEFRLGRYVAFGAADDLWQTAERLSLRALSIERLDNLTQERYLILYRWAVCGTEPTNELAWPASAKTGRLFRILRLGGRLWIEALAADNVLSVDGIPLESESGVPLSNGLKLSDGGSFLSFGEFRQVGL